ncbi:hypothetical protein GJA_581 [Janthinobacterium agaricidamnosum NBRC 102515 = DSM 9628]|uniref:Uncharacterized protein n=1 Tax=Janthinobacterium agaricidamnosum NBRC 102515 = DSM 9628 TaxID=1349767 RepID=W0V0U4_9BURK|nr:hypothetical protein GJA_581 [Janthinobacterium agaricidamnosum NBRC 102515 = DSM 9628]
MRRYLHAKQNKPLDRRYFLMEIISEWEYITLSTSGLIDYAIVFI